MNFYKIKNKIIYRKYRMVKKIIWSIKYTDMKSFKSDIMTLINTVNSYNYLMYGEYICLYELNNYYAEMCIDEMDKRLKVKEKEVFD